MFLAAAALESNCNCGFAINFLEKSGHNERRGGGNDESFTIWGTIRGTICGTIRGTFQGSVRGFRRTAVHAESPMANNSCKCGLYRPDAWHCIFSGVVRDEAGSRATCNHSYA